ncbi:UbiA family prenyltransferase [Amycolatopsis rifamycinica]|uniref:1,4-dihydroxy-2-naphthoate prenyltransferase n=1 Tax=Amycolatopsis rifamycinica TaxID=287986 RepID=A0A066U9U7_9PSEU|nr:UbiA family prenyltransferase [Amycolatopsis rifamycinica]KDN22622.1 1,4-dihydroxy-2-naphthoate prenyltransferase [Amycolatopsis rifamycinica]
MTRATVRAAVPGTREAKLVSYARLAKLDVFDYYLSLPVVLSAVLPPIGGFDPRTLVTLGLFGLGAVLMTASLVAFDDLTGYRDGSDTANYRADPTLRRARRKPLVAGTLTEPEVVRFGWLTAFAGAGVFAVAVATAPYAPQWTVWLIVANFVFGIQYSYGLKISYHGFQEAYIAALGWVMVLAPYGLLTGRFDGFVLVQALLFGLGPLLFGVYSNTNDIAGDRSVGRPTVAALTTPRGNRRFVAALSLGEFLLGAAASATGVAPWWFVLLMLPVTVLRARQFGIGFGPRGDILRARAIGFTAHRVGAALLVTANLIAAVTP